MKRQRWMKAAVLAAAVAAAVSLAGCQSKDYQKIEIPAEAGETDEGGAGTDGAGQNAAGADQNAAAGDSAVAVSTSPVNAPVTTETAPVMETRDETVYVTASQVNVRAAAQPGAEVVTKLDAGASLHRTGYSDSWSQVEYDGKTCYISSQYLSTKQPETAAETTAAAKCVDSGEITLNPDWKYADFSKIYSGAAVLYRSEAANRKGKVVAVNAGHGTKGGSNVKTKCHPDGTPKVTGGTTGAGATTAVAVSGGMTFADGTSEAKVTLAMAKVLKEKLLARGYDVLMIRESDDVQLDNVARTVIANNAADCHIALHWDSTSSNKGAFYMAVPNVSSYRSMEPVASHWKEHHALGDSLIAGLKGAGVKIFSEGSMGMDLTQTSFSTVPSIDIELGDKASDHSASTLDNLGTGLADGVDRFFGN